MEAAIISAITIALQNLPTLIAAGKDVTALVENVIKTFQGKTAVSQADLDAMVAKSVALEDEIMASLPEGN